MNYIMKLGLITAILLSCYTINSKAQLSAFQTTAKVSDHKRTKAKKILLEIEDIDEKKKQKLIKKGKYEEEKTKVDKANKRVTDNLKNRWYLPNEVVTMSKAEIKALKKAKDRNYILYNSKKRVEAWNEKQGNVETKYRLESLFDFLLDFESGKYIGVVNYGQSTDFARIASLAMLQQIMLEGQNGNIYNAEYIDQVNKNQAILLKEKTLLINSDYTKMSIEKIKEVYPYEVELVDPETIISHIKEKSDQYIYVFVGYCPPSHGRKHHHAFIDIETNKPIMFESIAYKRGFMYSASRRGNFVEEFPYIFTEILGRYVETIKEAM